MVAKSHQRGHEIEYLAGQWCYSDTGELAEYDRSCKRCGDLPTAEGYDACIGYIPGALSVCCGHGVCATIIILEKDDSDITKNKGGKEMGNDIMLEDSVETEVNERLCTLIMQAIGQASMCWENVSAAGVFDSQAAVAVGESLLHDIQQVIADLLG